MAMNTFGKHVVKEQFYDEMEKFEEDGAVAGGAGVALRGGHRRPRGLVASRVIWAGSHAEEGTVALSRSAAMPAGHGAAKEDDAFATCRRTPKTKTRAMVKRWTTGLVVYRKM